MSKDKKEEKPVNEIAKSVGISEHMKSIPIKPVVREK